MRRYISLSSQAVRNATALYTWNDQLNIWIVKTDHGCSIERYFVYKIRKALNNVVHAFVRFHVLLIDVRDHRNGRIEHQERSVALIGLCNKPFRFSELGI